MASEFTKLENEVLKGGVESSSAVSKLIELLKVSEKGSENYLAIVHSLRRCFNALHKHGDLFVVREQNEKDLSVDELNALKTYNLWITREFCSYLRLVAVLVHSESPSAQVTGIRTMMHFTQISKSADSLESIFNYLLSQIICSIKKYGDLNGQVYRVLHEEYINTYFDIKHLVLSFVKRYSEYLKGERSPKNYHGQELLRFQEEKEISKHLILANLFTLLGGVDANEISRIDKKMKYFFENSSWRDLKKFRREFQTAWLSFLSLPFPSVLYKKVLSIIDAEVLPHFINPLLLSDFLIDAYDNGGVSSLLALGALYHLMSQHGLEYPLFYHKLYSIIQPSIFDSQTTPKFCELIDLFISSSHLSAQLVAAFIKKLARIALTLSPPGIMQALVLVHNMFKRHPQCLILLDNNFGKSIDHIRKQKVEHIRTSSKNLAIGNKLDNKTTIAKDPFLFSALDPLKSNAINSSLWELKAFRVHYSPAVVSLVNGLFFEEIALSMKTRKFEPPVVISDFSLMTTDTLIDQELRRKGQKRKQPSTNHALLASPLALRRSKDENPVEWSCLSF